MNSAKKIMDKGSEYAKKETERLQRVLEKVGNKSFHTSFNLQIIILNLETNFHISSYGSRSVLPKLMNSSSRRTFFRPSLLKGDDPHAPTCDWGIVNSATPTCHERKAEKKWKENGYQRGMVMEVQRR